MPELKRSERTLIIIGGHEDKEGDKLILREVARRIGSGKLVVATVASQVPGQLWEDYQRVFRALGVRHLYKLDIESREQAMSERSVQILDDAVGVFFTGGDQLKITSQLGHSPVCQRIQQIYESGGVIAGTSAGASVMSETMLVSGESSTSPTVADAVQLAPGLGLVRGLIVDQHFAERGRIGRLIAAVAQNPRILGVGIDENTAVVLERDQQFRIIGRGAVYLVDGQHVSYTNITEESRDSTLSIFDMRVHVLSQGDTFDCSTRRPDSRPSNVGEEELLGAGADD